ncbi:YeiH family protein [Polymorphobacter fuscus]|uniref:Putative sulfate exporter family transporter n=1 Tax=Sandarakinorhabdus fusca TaxID=1439888 RepID=A0A7C9GTP3_9SPHN|nr:putative sulfate exporter family transporter [Polymorphobacter fuscus]KAB7648689.1 putative sulfate exporter family transporter [Polymorphobacter fuscus]MQT16249.1 putative sulfate exporter family transporter [Polymorphobacter fuscus]
MPRQHIPQAADLFGDIEATPKVRPRDYLPGLVVAVLATMAAASLTQRYGAPLTLMALLIGLALNFLSADRRLTPGLTLASRELLRWAIVLVGARITLAQIAALGPESLVMVVITVTVTIAAGVGAARLLGFSAPFGVLAGGAVAICGGSAAMALSATLGERRVRQAELTLVLVGISAMSALAMMVYPTIAHGLGFNDAQAGYFLGGSIHDVAQALGAGYAFSPAAGETATIVKLARVAMLAPVLGVIALRFPPQLEITAPHGKPTARTAIVPWFVLGFFGVAAINSTGIIPAPVSLFAADSAAWMLAISVAATAIRSPLAEILKAGPKPLLVIAVSTLTAFALSLLYAWLGIS